MYMKQLIDNTQVLSGRFFGYVLINLFLFQKWLCLYINIFEQLPLSALLIVISGIDHFMSQWFVPWI